MADSSALHLLLGDEEFLVERAVSDIIGEVRESSATSDLPVNRVRAGDVGAAELAELLSPSLFADDRVVVIENAAEAGKDPVALIGAAAADLPEGITLVVAHSGGGRAKALATTLRSAGAQVHDCSPITRASDRMEFVRNEFRANGVRADRSVVAALTDAVGSGLRELAAACSQLAADTGGKVDVAAVHRYYLGRPEVTGFEVADKAVAGDRAGALESLAWARHHGVAHVILADALAEAVHAIARVRGIGSMNENAAAARVGMPPWRVRKVQGQARAWDSESVARALVVVSRLNGDVKGQAADPDFSLQEAVGAVASLCPAPRG